MPIQQKKSLLLHCYFHVFAGLDRITAFVAQKVPEYIHSILPYLVQITSIYRQAKTVYGNIRDRIQALFGQCFKVEKETLFKL